MIYNIGSFEEAIHYDYHRLIIKLVDDMEEEYVKKKEFLCLAVRYRFTALASVDNIEPLRISDFRSRNSTCSINILIPTRSLIDCLSKALVVKATLGR